MKKPLFSFPKRGKYERLYAGYFTQTHCNSLHISLQPLIPLHQHARGVLGWNCTNDLQASTRRSSC